MTTLIDGPADADATFLFAHGAGAGMEHEFMQTVATELGDRGTRVIRFEFPYMIKRRQDGRKRPPDRELKLLDAFRQQIADARAQGPLVIGGKSMGGRMASLLAAREAVELGISGVICLGFPFHPPGKPERFRGEHLQQITTPTLILQGERDTFGNRQELATMTFSAAVKCQFLADGDHSFKPRKASGHTQAQHISHAVSAMSRFIQSLSG